MDKTDEKALREIGEGMEALLGGIVPGFDPIDKAELLAAMVKGNYCKNCGKPLTQKGNGRRRLYCCDKCSREYWRNNPRPDRWRSYERVRCAFCGTWFYARKDAHRKYCSADCGHKGRSMEAIRHRLITDSCSCERAGDGASDRASDGTKDV